MGVHPNFFGQKSSQVRFVMGRVYLVTGANSGIGKETVRQLLELTDTDRVYLACRSASKARNAIESFGESSSTRASFLPFDASAAKAEIQKLAFDSIDNEDQLDGVILNAGGPGNDASGKPVGPNGVLDIVQTNLIGHFNLLEGLEGRGLLHKGCHVVFSGSESARGIPAGMAMTPVMGSTIQDFVDFIVIGRQPTSSSSSWWFFFKKPRYKTMEAYGYTKGLGALCFAEWARRKRDYHVLTVSPGGTVGTSILTQQALPWLVRWFPSLVMMVLGWTGFWHSLETGARRYVDAVTGVWDTTYPSGSFLASRGLLVTGPVGDQILLSGAKQYADPQKQLAAYQALQQFL